MLRRVMVRACSITETGASCVVNASNDSARLGGGVSRALFVECGGSILQEEMTRQLEAEFDGVLAEGDCLVTSGGTSARIRHVLHVPAVDYRGPRARQGHAGIVRTVTSAERVRTCTLAALHAAADLGASEAVALAFPLLGAGAGGLSVETVCLAMRAGLKVFFGEWRAAPISVIFIAVPEPDRVAVAQKLIGDAT